MSSGPGWPDDMRRVLAHGDVLADHANVALPNPPGAKSYGPFPVPHATALRVMVAPTGGNVTCTLTWTMDGVSNTASGSSSLTFTAGTALSQLATCLGHLVTIDLVGSVNGVTCDVWAVTANPLASSGTSGINLVPPMIIGSNFYYAPAGSLGTVTHTLNGLFCTPIWLPAGVTLNRIGIEETIAGGGGNVQRLGIYRDSGGGFPGALKLDAGTVSTTGASGGKEITIAFIVPDPGLYWLAVVGQVGANAQLRALTNNYAWPFAECNFASYSTAGLTLNGYGQAGVAGALPDPFTGQVRGTTVARPYVRVA